LETSTWKDKIPGGTDRDLYGTITGKLNNAGWTPCSDTEMV